MRRESREEDPVPSSGAGSIVIVLSSEAGSIRYDDFVIDGEIPW